jgi:hypothetical protein
MAPPNVADDKPDENGITETMLDFSWERDVKAMVCGYFVFRLDSHGRHGRHTKSTGKNPKRR